MNTLYCVSRLSEWVECARLLHARLGWRPAYWVTRPEIEQAVQSAFPGIVAHPVFDLNRGLPAAGIQEHISWELSQSDLIKAAPFEPIAMDMLDRVDLGRSFSHQERQRLVHRLLAYWSNVIEGLDLRVAVFNTPPHAIGEYTAYASFRIKGLATRVFRYTPVSNLHFACDTIERLPEMLKDAYEGRLASGQTAAGAQVVAHCEGLRVAAPDYRPWYVRDSVEREARRRELVRKLETAMASGHVAPGPFVPGQPVLARRENPNTSGLEAKEENILSRTPKPHHQQPTDKAFKLPGRPLSAPGITKWEYLLYRDWAMVQKLAMQKRYEELAEPVDLRKDYVYFAMHYQPERTTCPDGGRFNNQFLAIALLAASLPQGWSFYVKEHPAQFHYLRMGELSRWLGYHDDLAQLPNVKLVPLDTPGLNLTDGARAVATITGAAGWEALNRGKPVLCFGAAWYGMCRGAFLIEEREDAERALAAIARGLRPNFEETLAYAAAIEHIGKRLFTNPSLEKAVELDQELSSGLAGLLEQYEKHLCGRS